MLAGQDLLIAVVNALDGEKDPRCLMAAFSLSAHVAQLYAQHADQVGPPGCYLLQRLSKAPLRCTSPCQILRASEGPSDNVLFPCTAASLHLSQLHQLGCCNCQRLPLLPCRFLLPSLVWRQACQSSLMC